VALSLTLAATAACKKQNAYVPPPPPQVGVAKPLHQGVTPYLELTGHAVAFNQVDLVARVEGFLQTIDYKDGATAKQGDTLFVIEPTPSDPTLTVPEHIAGVADGRIVVISVCYAHSTARPSEKP
jgi:membrane fusion protein, multidrug efflux system